MPRNGEHALTAQAEFHWGRRFLLVRQLVQAALSPSARPATGCPRPKWGRAGGGRAPRPFPWQTEPASAQVPLRPHPRRRLRPHRRSSGRHLPAVDRWPCASCAGVVSKLL